MSALRDLILGFLGSVRLLRGDRQGLAFFDATAGGARRSFYAALVVAPPVLLMLLLAPAEDAPPLWQQLVVEGLAYTLNWTVFPLLLHQGLALFQRTSGFWLWLSVKNWSRLLTVLIYVPFYLCVSQGWLPMTIAAPLFALCVLGLLAYDAFLLRVTLQLRWGIAVPLAGLDLFLATQIGLLAALLYRPA